LKGGWWMFFSIVSSMVVGGLVVYSHLNKTGNISDAAKIQRIARNCGLFIKEGKEEKTIQLFRRHKNKWGTEYVYRIPLGLSFKDFEDKLDNFNDGINNKKSIIELSDLNNLDFRKEIVQQLKKMANKKLNKEIYMKYDGMLRISIYDEALTERFDYDEKLLSSCKGWKVPVGISRTGVINHDTEKIPHFIVAGGTDKGKSVFVHVIINTLIHNKPNDVNLYLIDLKGGLEFNRYKNLKQVHSFAKDAIEALLTLQKVKQDMNKMMDYLLMKGFSDIKEAGIKERHFVVVDEAAEISSSGEVDTETKKIKIKCENIITDIARRGRAAGFRLIYATQYPTNETLRSQVRQNIGARLCFPLETSAASLAVLDEKGAEDLPLIKGRAIYKTDRKTIVQAPLIEKELIDKTIKPHMVRREKIEPRERKKARANTLVIEEA
jgi:hypothetical protein